MRQGASSGSGSKHPDVVLGDIAGDSTDGENKGLKPRLPNPLRAYPAGTQIAFLVSEKKCIDESVVVGMPTTVNYTVFNLGTGNAFDVFLTDNINTDTVALLEGEAQYAWPVIAPGQNVTHSIRITPLVPGILHLNPAHVTYRRHESDSPDDSALSITSTGMPVLSKTETEHAMDISWRIPQWIIFLVLLGLPVGVPHYLIANINKRYQNGLLKPQFRSSKKKSE